MRQGRVGWPLRSVLGVAGRKQNVSSAISSILFLSRQEAFHTPHKSPRALSTHTRIPRPPLPPAPSATQHTSQGENTASGRASPWRQCIVHRMAHPENVHRSPQHALKTQYPRKA